MISSICKSSSLVRNMSTATKPKTAIVMLNMGGPENTAEVIKPAKCESDSRMKGSVPISALKSHLLYGMRAPFKYTLEQQKRVGGYLHRIMTDRDMIQLPIQSKLGPWIAQRRTEEVQKKYKEIGGGSPILKWTNLQGKLLTQELDLLCPDTAPHKHYVAFRYVPPFTDFTFDQLEKDGVERAIIFSQYPQYSCATTGSSLNAIADFYKTRPIPSSIEFSLIERWATHPLLAQCFAERIRRSLEAFPESERDDVLVLFSAHSLPLKAVSRGDTYPHEVAATVAATMAALRAPNPHRLVWQSKVGPLPWLQPYTDDAIKAYAKQGKKHLILVPIAFVNEHIETLHELDIEYCAEVAKEAGITQIERVETPNDHPTFIGALADIVRTHLKAGPRVSKQFLSRCPHCVSKRCEMSKNFFRNLCSPAKVRNTTKPIAA